MIKPLAIPPNIKEYLPLAQCSNPDVAIAALRCPEPGIREFATLLSPAADDLIEPMAQKARDLTRRHFGRTVSLYVPLYLSNHCPGGCVYCGFAKDREQERRRLERDELSLEMAALKAKGFSDVLLLTGGRAPEADFDYVLDCVTVAVEYFHNVSIECFAMTTDEYRKLAKAGCTGVTVYQETYDPEVYSEVHNGGDKQDYGFRLQAPERILSAGMRTVGMGILCGLSDPVADSLSLFKHVEDLRSRFWQGGFMISFPRICGQQGGYEPNHVVSDRFLARIIFAFRICFPDVPLVLSTREKQSFRDGMIGNGICRMSVASRTTVGGYSEGAQETEGQFDVSDTRDVGSFCGELRRQGFEPVFKSWDSVFNS
jgi:2-iminoacetate synthase